MTPSPRAPADLPAPTEADRAVAATASRTTGPDGTAPADWATRWTAALGRRRKVVLLGWVVLLAVAGALAGQVSTMLSGGGWFVAGSQSEQAVHRIADADLLGRNATGLTLVVHSDAHAVGSPEFAADFAAVSRHVQGLSSLDVRSQYGWGTTTGPAQGRFVGHDGHTVVQSVGLGVDDGTARRELPALQKGLDEAFASHGISASMVSPAALWGEVNSLSEHDLMRAELFCLPLILVILFVLFRSVASAAVAVLVGVASIVMALGVVALVARQVEMSIFVQNTASMLGLGVAVDYSLFIISRYLREVEETGDRPAALATAVRTSGHSVLFSGATVVLTMATLFFVDLNVIQSIALGAVLVVAFAVLNALVFLPALMALMGHRLEWGRLGRRPGGRGRPGARSAEPGRRWAAVVALVMRRPVIALVLTVGALGALALPSMDLKTFSPDARVLPASSTVRHGFDLVQAQFGVGETSPVTVVVRSDDPLWAESGRQALGSLQAGLESLGGQRGVVSPLTVTEAAGTTLAVASAPGRLPADLRQTLGNLLSADGRTAVLSVVPAEAASSSASLSLVEAVRAVAAQAPPGLDVVVGGESAEGLDSNAVINDSIPVILTAMLVIIYLVLLVTFRSVLLPLKAVAINLLSVGATYGILVLVFQRGWLTDLTGLTHTGNLQNFVPVLLVALLLSLSTDYEVFLLGRVREEYERTGDNTHSVVEGVRHTAPLISGAAILMVAVFGAFAFTGMVPIEQLGFGMALGVLLDATVIRLLVVPAAMKLMGAANWWLPFANRRPAGRHALQGDQP